MRVDESLTVRQVMVHVEKEIGRTAHAALPVEQPSPISGETEVVNVIGTRDPAMRAYRSVFRGLDAFEEHRQLAPNAVLRFRFAHKATVLKPGTVANKLEAGPPASYADGLVLRLASDAVSIPIRHSHQNVGMVMSSKG